MVPCIFRHHLILELWRYARLRTRGQPRCSASLTLEVDLPCAHKTHFFQTFWYLTAYSF